MVDLFIYSFIYLLLLFFFFFFWSTEAYPIVRQLEKITVKKAQAKVVKCANLIRNVCVCRGGGGDAPPAPQQLINKNTPSLARISKIKKSLLRIKFPIVFQFTTFPIQKLDFIRTGKKKRAKKIKTLFKVYLKLSLWLFNLNFEKEISQ